MKNLPGYIYLNIEGAAEDADFKDLEGVTWSQDQAAKKNVKYIAADLIEPILKTMAETHPSDNVANWAMDILRSLFDKTYKFCEDCDGLVTKESECCLNRVFDESEDEEIYF